MVQYSTHSARGHKVAMQYVAVACASGRHPCAVPSSSVPSQTRIRPDTRRTTFFDKFAIPDQNCHPRPGLGGPSALEACLRFFLVLISVRDKVVVIYSF